MSASPADIARAKEIGAQGGTVPTSQMSDVDRQKIDKAVNDGRNGK